MSLKCEPSSEPLHSSAREDEWGGVGGQVVHPSQSICFFLFATFSVPKVYELMAREDGRDGVGGQVVHPSLLLYYSQA